MSWFRNRSWLGLVIGGLFTAVATLLSVISSQRYFVICATSSACAVLGIACCTWTITCSRRFVLRSSAIFVAVIAAWTITDAAGRAKQAWHNEQQMRFACRIAAECKDMHFVAGPGDGYLEACGEVFDISRLGNAVELRRAGQIAGGAFVNENGHMMAVPFNCGPELWNRAVDAERGRTNPPELSQ